jgi:hypothetical protein
MFGQSKPVVFDRYAGRRPRRRVPRWLLILLLGVASGAAGVLVAQERYLPPRLSASESAHLRSTLEQAQGDRMRLQDELGTTTRKLEAALAERKSLAEQLEASRQSVQRLRSDVSALVAALPPDPRGGAVQVRAARFESAPGKLSYDIVLSRERAGGKPLNGVLQLVVTGAPRRGGENNVKPQPVAVSLGSVETLHGELGLPEGFDPRQATIQVLDHPAGKLLGMRVMLVK